MLLRKIFMSCNNVIVGNGTASGATGGRVGLQCSSCGNNFRPTGKVVKNNLFYQNKLGDLNDPSQWIDSGDSDNYTPFSSWSINGTSGGW